MAFSWFLLFRRVPASRVESDRVESTRPIAASPPSHRHSFPASRRKYATVCLTVSVRVRATPLHSRRTRPVAPRSRPYPRDVYARGSFIIYRRLCASAKTLVEASQRSATKSWSWRRRRREDVARSRRECRKKQSKGDRREREREDSHPGYYETTKARRIRVPLHSSVSFFSLCFQFVPTR